MSKIKGGFRFAPFSPKQLKILGWWLDGSSSADFDGVIADGAIRSGKTLSMSLSFVMWATQNFSGANFALCGKTVTSLRRNVISPLEQMLSSLPYSFSDRRTDNLITVSYRGRENYFYLFGGKDEASRDLIQGITLAGVLFDEVALMPESFVNQATARCSVEGAKWWFNCNPEGPYHWFKTGWIDRASERRLLYVHFLMTDNLTLSQRTLDRYRGMYTGVFARRFILGEWSAADGVIYSMFDDSKNVAEDIPFSPERDFVAVDYGTFNPCVFLHFFAAGTGDNISHYVDREYFHDGRCSQNGVPAQKDDGQYSSDMLAFTGGRRDVPIIIDPSASSFITRLRHDGFTNVIPAKNSVAKGISVVSSQLVRERLLLSPECVHTLGEIPSYVWDSKYAASCGEDRPLKENDHCCDALRYGVYFDFVSHPALRPSVKSRGTR
ncbi:MAG: PBSX family phage terminase large subunit [Clostridia bacterium]|nr:PBSX family phage terminase large subunit [Clostridia bacterium]